MIRVRYVFDGSFTGLLCCIFRAYEFKDRWVSVTAAQHDQPHLFEEKIHIVSDEQRAKRVWTGICKKTTSQFQKQFYFVSLTEQAKAFQHLFNAARYILDQSQAVYDNFAQPDILALAQLAKQVGCEKHRMEAFVRFKKTAEGIYFAVVNPDFNVLPLIQKHFKARYADQKWLIYDELRQYGVFYDLQQIHEITLNSHLQDAPAEYIKTSISLDQEEALYDQLWKDYFKSATIIERKNMKLHIQLVPKRYWHYLNEKA